jgi:predicted aldo/keto reductase-like oxidoreductase
MDIHRGEMYDYVFGGNGNVIDGRIVDFNGLFGMANPLCTRSKLDVKFAGSPLQGNVDRSRRGCRLRLSARDAARSATMFEDKTKNTKVGGISRREFVGMTVAATVAVGAEKLAWAGVDSKTGMTYRTLGRTGEKVSMMGLGGYHIGNQKDEQESIKIIREAIDNGVNFLDNCWDYNGGESEVRMGKALRDGYRQRAFLMTKIDGRTRKAATDQLEESLQRLQTDHIDLLQFHEIIRMGDPEKVFAAGAGMEAIVEARKAGKVRYIGFTGHKSPDIHLKMLETADAHGFHFDTVQMPLNVMDAHFNSFGKKVLPMLVKKEIGVLGMKPMGSGWILRSNVVKSEECLHYAMNLPTSVVITGCDSLEILNSSLQAARNFRPMNQTQVAELLAKTADSAHDGKFEGYKTTDNFDGTGHNPQWLG